MMFEKRIYSLIKSISNTIVLYIPHYKFERRIKLTQLLSNLCLIRSELNLEVLNFSNKVENLSIIHNSMAHVKPIDKNNIYTIEKFKRRINSTSVRINYLISMNCSTTKHIKKINEDNYLLNPDFEKGVSASIIKAKMVNKKYEILTKKISMLDSTEIA